MELDFWLVLAAFLAVFVSIGFGIWSNLNTQRSNHLYEREQEKRLRPILIVKQPKVKWLKIDNKKITYDQYLTMDTNQRYDEVTFHFFIENRGLITAKNIHVGKIESSVLTTSKDLLELDITRTEEYDLSPSETMEFVFSVPKLINNAKYYVSRRIEYEYPSKQKIKKVKILVIWSQDIHGLTNELQKVIEDN